MNIKKYFHLNYLLLILLIALFSWAIYRFVYDTSLFYHSENISYASYRLHKRHSQKPVLAPEKIAGWMTFRYINYIFNLPPEFFKTELNITEKKYPNITLDKYAMNNKLNPKEFLETTRQILAKKISSEKK